MGAWIVVDLGFGDAGKGGLVDFLVREHRAHTVVRFNGGAQAAHNVVLPDGRHHTFSQFGSGTFVPGVKTHVSRFMLVDPAALVAEERHLRSIGVGDAFERLSVDERSIVVTPYQKAANRLREMSRGDGRHGSCGMGIGETMADFVANERAVLRVGELLDRGTLRDKLRALQAAKRGEVAALRLPGGAMVEQELRLLRDAASVEEFATLFEDIARRVQIVPSAVEALEGDVIFEGAQGVLLDEWHGFHPHTTWSTTTFANAETLLAECGYTGEVTRIGAMRAYLTRHGAGPFVTEDAALSERLPEPHNRTNDWQHGFRVGWMDLAMMRYALEVVGGVDELAVTCVDHLDLLEELKICTGYRGGETLRVDRTQDLAHQERMGNMLRDCRPVYETVTRADYVEMLAERLGVPVGIASHGPTFRDKALCFQAVI